MKKLLLILAVLILLGVLVIVYLPITPNEQTPVVGADRDTHGCIASAGYTYSVVRDGCIRLWEEGVALAPVGAEEDGPVLVAYVVQSADSKEAEIFFPGVKQGLIMNRVENVEVSTWAADGWTLSYDPDSGWKLSQAGELVYASKAQ